ncbi:MAG TPA: anaerobic ribonucleoside-triphosphate reductase activating protein [Candidatus Gallacutalibacter stercoravium]|nr:anaerobic ribonucleoside-triphosphate reductase activating protein [Candidatus Gallacutalibacter stercoravium]
MTHLRLAGVIRESIVDGPGIRLVVFAQGCPHHCPGCHNPNTHDPSGGYDSSVENIIEAVKKNPLLSGVTLSGGDPFAQAPGLAELATEVHALGLNVVTYTGYTFEQLLAGAGQQPGWQNLLEQTDILIDGPFLLKEKTLTLPFRGSRNQRVLDVPASLAQGRAVEYPL